MMTIQLVSATLSRSELEAGLSLSRAFFPEAKVELAPQQINDSNGQSEVEADLIHIDVVYPEPPWAVSGFYFCHEDGRKVTFSMEEEEIKLILSQPYVGKETPSKLLLKRGLLKLLSLVTGHTPPWGILTGIRPSKILHRLQEEGYSASARERALRNLYALRQDKIQLLQEVVAIQQPFLSTMKKDTQRIALYLGIPFCPSRCSYCSFPAYSLTTSREPLESYLKGLGEEIRVTGEWMAEAGLVADSIYLGGGTPTILTAEELSSLIHLVKRNIPLFKGALFTNPALDLPIYDDKLEFSVEAGRPDTLSPEKFEALRQEGVNRISINPQTMHDETLKRIGRAHKVEDILRIYELARRVSDWVINMDIIIGLPGESVTHIEETLQGIKELAPDNLTAHALAIKRGSKEHEQGLTQNLGRELEAMQEIVMTQARAMGMNPYYLYRQKQIAGNLENIGFAKPGLECRYNIGIMEEYQTVIGLGAGASSKIVDPRDFSLSSFHHPANWQIYLERWPVTQEKRREAHRQIIQF